MSLLRDTTFGVLLHDLSGGKLFRWPEEYPDYQIPAKYLQHPGNKNNNRSRSTLIVEENDKKSIREEAASSSRDEKRRSFSSEKKESEEDNPSRLEAGLDAEKNANKTSTDIVVEWDGPDDPDNPQNWSARKKTVFTACIMFLTFSVYIGSAIYTPSIPGIMEKFNVSQTVATLGLSLFVFAYGLGPMILSPLSEAPSIGRNPVYIVTLFLFVVLQLPAILSNNFAVILVMRFLTGFIGSPALATGGASLGEIYAPLQLPYAIALWAVGGVAGPVIGPLVGGYAAEAKGWKWPLWELLWVSGAALCVLFFFLSESYGPTILLKKAQRLRKLTGNPNIKSQTEIDNAHLDPMQVWKETLIRPFTLLFEPIVLFANVYIGLAYSIFYLWFEAFPMTFVGIHGFSQGSLGLAFIGILLGAWLAAAAYVYYQWKVVIPGVLRTGTMIPEDRLKIALVGSLFIPVSLFFFGWTARKSVHWIVPIIAAGLYTPGIILLFQSVIIYLPMSYPKYAASLLAGNALFRSAMAAGFPLFGTAMYDKLTIQGGCSLLAGLSILMIPPLWILYRHGAKIRGWSKYASA